MCILFDLCRLSTILRHLAPRGLSQVKGIDHSWMLNAWTSCTKVQTLRRWNGRGFKLIGPNGWSLAFDSRNRGCSLIGSWWSFSDRLGKTGGWGGVRKNPSTFIGELLSERSISAKKESNANEGADMWWRLVDEESSERSALLLDLVGGGGHIIEVVSSIVFRLGVLNMLLVY